MTGSRKFSYLIRLGIVLVCFLAVEADEDVIDDSAPQYVRILQKAKATSAEFEVKRLQGGVPGPCKYGHVVHYKLSERGSDWSFARIEETASGQFRMSGLQPGQQYEVRVACKDHRTPSSPGEFSTPMLLETPLLNPIKPPGRQENLPSPESEEVKEVKEGSTGSHTVSPATTLLVAVTIFMVTFRATP